MVEVRSLFARVQAPDILQALTDDVRAQLAESIAANIHRRWTYMAGQLPRSIRALYLQGIQEVKLNGTTAVVALVGQMPNQLEHGSGGKDLRDTLLGPNVPVVPARQGLRGKHQSKKGGYYRAIPFRHGTPGSQGSAGAPMGQAYTGQLGTQKAKELGKAIYAAAKQLKGSTTEPFRIEGHKGGNFETKKPGSKWGARLPSFFAGARRLKDHHLTDIYAGMVRLQKTYQGATQSSYMTFRTISTNKPTGWRTGVVQGAQIMHQIEQELPSIGVQVIKAFSQSLSSGNDGQEQPT